MLTHAQRIEYQREYYRTHKEAAKAYHQKNREKRNAYSRQYYRQNKWKWEDFYSPRAIVKAAREECR